MTEAARLSGNIGRFQYLALGFGTMIGSAWVILLGDWLGKAGPGGAVVGFLAGGVVVAAIGACYAELAARLPEAGSEFIYAYRVYGPRLAFVVGWFLLLYFVSVTVFEAIALAWLVEVFAPAWRAPALYAAFGFPISTQTLAIGIGGAALIFGANYRGARLAVAAHSVLTYGFLAVVAVLLIALVVHGSPQHLAPAFATTNGRPWWLGAGAIFAFCAYALNGFQTIPQAVEERSASTSLAVLGRIIVWSIVAAALFYCFAVLAASIILPWRDLVGAPLPMASAVAALPKGALLVQVLLLTTAASLLKAWNGVFMMAARVVVAMARAGQLPPVFARLHPRYGSPAAALVLVGSLNVGGIFFGKGAIEPITDMCAMVLTLTYVMCCVTVLRLYRRESPASGAIARRTIAWLGTLGSAVMVVVAFVSPFWEQQGLPFEFRLLGVWAVLGVLTWHLWVGRAEGK